MILTDTVALDAKGARITRDGYLVADALVGRANNIQTYTAAELGLKDRAPDAQVRIFRPEAEVFATDSLSSLAGRPVTIDHPPVMVDAKNWKQYAKGDIGNDVLRDGEFIRVPFKIMDQAAVESACSDRPEFSLGYQAEIVMAPGVFDGAAYDGSLSQIRYNHLAACKNARGGSELRIVDERPARPTPETNTMKTLIIDGLQVADVSPAAEAAIVKLQGLLADAVKAKDTADTKMVELTAEATVKDAEIVTLKKAVEDAKVTPAQMRDAAKAYAKALTDAKALAPTATLTDDMDEAAIKRAVVDAKMGDAAKGMTDEHVAVAFAVLARDVKPADPIRETIKDGVVVQDAPGTAYDKMKAGLRDAWSKEAA